MKTMTISRIQIIYAYPEFNKHNISPVVVSVEVSWRSFWTLSSFCTLLGDIQLSVNASSVNSAAACQPSPKPPLRTDTIQSQGSWRERASVQDSRRTSRSSSSCHSMAVICRSFDDRCWGWMMWRMRGDMVVNPPCFICILITHRELELEFIGSGRIHTLNLSLWNMFKRPPQQQI